MGAYSLPREILKNTLLQTHHPTDPQTEIVAGEIIF